MGKHTRTRSTKTRKIRFLPVSAQKCSAFLGYETPFDVLFGNLTGDDIRFLQISSPSVAMNLAVLYEIAYQRRITPEEIARKYGRKVSHIRQSVYNLLGRGFLWQEGLLGSPHVSIKGRAYL